MSKFDAMCIAAREQGANPMTGRNGGRAFGQYLAGFGPDAEPLRRWAHDNLLAAEILPWLVLETAECELSFIIQDTNTETWYTGKINSAAPCSVSDVKEITHRQMIRFSGMYVRKALRWWKTCG